MLHTLRAQGVESAFVALGDNRLRQRVGAHLRAIGFALSTAIHPSALISPSARIGAGAVVMARSIVGTESIIDDLAILNTGAVIDYDNRLYTAAHVAPSCALAGNVTVGERALGLRRPPRHYDRSGCGGGCRFGRRSRRSGRYARSRRPGATLKEHVP